MISDLYVHVGWPKTGTTSLQHALAAKRTSLRAAGIRYPRDGRTHGVNHVISAWDLMDQTGCHPSVAPYHDLLPPNELMPAPGSWDLLARESVGGPEPTVIVSAENLVLASHDAVEALCSTVPAQRTIIVATVRPVSAVLPSLHQQYVKSGGSLTLDPFVRHVVGAIEAHDPSFAWLDVSHLQSLWQGQEASRSFRVVDIAAQDPARMVEVVATALGVPGGVQAPLPMNRGLSAAATTALADLNRESPSAWYPDRLIVASRMIDSVPSLTDRGLGGALALDASAGRLLDTALPLDPLLAPPVGDRNAMLSEVRHWDQPLGVTVPGRDPGLVEAETRAAFHRVSRRTATGRWAYRRLAASPAGSSAYWLVQRARHR